MKNWYVLRTFVGKEKKIKDNLLRELSEDYFDNEIAEIHLPLEKIFTLRKGKKYKRERNFYPGYIFIESKEDRLSPETIDKIRTQPMVLNFLGGLNPTPITKRERVKILERMGQMESFDFIENQPFLINEEVMVMDGPFKSFKGNIVNINNKKKLLSLEVKIFGRKTPVDISFKQVDRLQTA